jgi:hypothetical protein
LSVQQSRQQLCRGCGARHQAQKDEAEWFARNILPDIDAIGCSGVSTLAGIAEALNARGLRSARGGRSRESKRTGKVDR